jgi:hypothetical protein
MALSTVAAASIVQKWASDYFAEYVRESGFKAYMGKSAMLPIHVKYELTDTGKTALEVRQMMPKAHFACVYAKPKGVPTIDTFVTEVSQDTWIYFPWDMGFTYQEPIAKGSKG